MANLTSLAGRTCVITGAANGIGRALAQRLAADGCPVAICDVDEPGLAQTAATLRGPVLARPLDVRDREAVDAFAGEVRGWAPAPFGMVVNNAGVTTLQPVAEAVPEDDAWVVDVNFWGVVHGTRAFLPALLEQRGGTLVNLSSAFGLASWPAQSAYCASKHAVRGYTEALRHELRDSGVRAVAVHPGAVRTGIFRHARFHRDDLGRTEPDRLHREFDAFARTTPERAAEVIQRGVERGRARILVGPDAIALAALMRLAPVHYFDVIAALQRVVRRR